MTQFREMRRKAQQLSQADSVAVLERATSGTLAVLGDDGYPYAVPLSYVYADGKLFFHSALAGHKVDAIRQCDKASFCVVDTDEVHPDEFTTYFRSVIAFGRVRIVDDPAEKREAARRLGARYNPDDEPALQRELDKGLAHMHVVEFSIEHLTGKQAIELTRKHNITHD